MHNLIVHLLQTDIRWKDIESNHRAAEQLLSSVPVSPPKGGDGVGLSYGDLFVLPEMWSTGFVMSPQGVAESHDESLQWMLCMSRELHAAFAGSVAVCEGGNYYNRLYFVTPDGTVTHYDKRHLFSYGGEDRSYTPGSDRTIVEWGGVRFCLQICYDLRFPCFSRNISQTPFHSGEGWGESYDCLIYVANWPASRRRVWDTLLQARAIENQCYVIGVNRVGDDPACHYDGGTAVIDAYGKTLVQAQDNTQEIISCRLDMDKLQAFRKKFPVLQDAD